MVESNPAWLDHLSDIVKGYYKDRMKSPRDSLRGTWDICAMAQITCRYRVKYYPPKSIQSRGLYVIDFYEGSIKVYR